LFLGFYTSAISFVSKYRKKGMVEELRGVILASCQLTHFALTSLTVIGHFAS
jgi:hypothetical protein